MDPLVPLAVWDAGSFSNKVSLPEVSSTLAVFQLGISDLICMQLYPPLPLLITTPQLRKTCCMTSLGLLQRWFSGFP